MITADSCGSGRHLLADTNSQTLSLSNRLQVEKNSKMSDQGSISTGERSIDTAESPRNTSTPLHPAHTVSGTTSDHQASNQQPEVNQPANGNTTTVTRSSRKQPCEDQSSDREHTASATPESTNDTPATSPAVEEANNSPTQDLSDAIGSTLSPELAALLEKYFSEFIPARVTFRRWLD